MIERIIDWSLKNRFLVACGALLLIALGARAVYQTPVDAIPDLTENQVLVYADYMGRSPQEVEDQVTFPLSTGLQGLAGVKEVRATSMFGFSLITIIFEDKVDTYFARARVLERLNYLQGTMPEGVKPQLGPDASGLGWVYQYYFDVDPTKVADGGYDLAALRSLQDWYVRYQLASVQGVAEVASIGGFVKQYQVELNSTKMRATNVTLMDVMTAVQSANLNVGGKVVEENGAEFVLRGIGLVTSVEDLELVTVKAMEGTPVFLKDIATVQIGGAGRMFFYMPFQHSEAMADQDFSLVFFQAYGDDNALEFAKKHHDMIARYGRFPHRNAALSRRSTPEEAGFLSTPAR